MTGIGVTTISTCSVSGGGGGAWPRRSTTPAAAPLGPAVTAFRKRMRTESSIPTGGRSSMPTELRAPMNEELVWANVMRPRIPLVYLDLNTIIYIARTLRGDRSVPIGYEQLYEAAMRAKIERRAAFPLGESHLWEISNVTDPRQRRQLA